MRGAHDLLTSVGKYRERFPQENVTTSLFQKFISDFLSNSDTNKRSIFDRTNFSPGHCTGSAWIVDPEHDKILLLHHKKLTKWLQLGGHADGDSNLFRVAMREAHEESGLQSIVGFQNINYAPQQIFDLDVHTIPARKDEPQHLHFDVRYLCRANSNDSPLCSEESNDVRWIQASELPQLSQEPSLLRMQSKWLTIKSEMDAGNARG